MSKAYLDYIDLAKGFGILLVIMGHSLFPLHFAIDVFHMPLFFTLAGMTYKMPKNRSEFLLKKIDRIFIPWIFFTTISTLMAHLVTPIREGAPFNGPLWFLQCIFVALLVYMLMDISLKKNVLSIIIIIFSIYTFLMAKCSMRILPFGLDNTLCAIVFLHIGRIIGAGSFLSFMNIKKIRLTIFVLMLIIVYVLSIYLFVNQYNTDGASFVNRKIFSYNYFLFYLASISAILLVLIISYQIKKLSLINYFGKNSLIILCVHFPFIERLNIFISKTSFYTQMGICGKIMAGLIVYAIIILICIPCIFICRRYIPTFTGYKNYFSSQK